MNCKDCQTALPDLLLDPAAPGNIAARAHLQSCSACNQEFTSLQSTFDLLDLWEAPGWFERVRSRVLFNTGRQFRPALAGGLALALIIGGTVASVTVGHPVPKVAASATVNDLQILDKNVQVLQTMDQLLQEENTNEEPVTTPLT